MDMIATTSDMAMVPLKTVGPRGRGLSPCNEQLCPDQTLVRGLRSTIAATRAWRRRLQSGASAAQDGSVTVVDVSSIAHDRRFHVQPQPPPHPRPRFHGDDGV